MRGIDIEARTSAEVPAIVFAINARAAYRQLGYPGNLSGMSVDDPVEGGIDSIGAREGRGYVRGEVSGRTIAMPAFAA